ncbi:MAG: 50S ribosomal protein L25 [bacterium]|nr:50S ribosomal protein L25 [bacterium]
MAAVTLKAEKREITGRKVKTLRKSGLLPGNVYGKKVKSLSVQVSLDEFKKVFSEVGETGLVELKVNGDTRPVLIHNVQLDPVLDFPLHADFLQVDLKEKVTATVPLEFVGESPAQKSGEGIVVEQVREIEVEALPGDLPEKITVDISGLAKVDDAIKVADLPIDRSKVEVKDEAEKIVVSVAPLTKEEVVVAPPPVVGEVPAEGAVPPVEGGAAPGQAPTAEGTAPEAQKPAEEKQGKQG